MTSSKNDPLMEDPCLGVDVPDDLSTLKLKGLRNKITFNPKEKEKLVNKKFTVNFKGGRSEVSLGCEILCLLSNLLKGGCSRGEDTIILHNILHSTLPPLLKYISSLKFPFTRHDISILRSFKNISINLEYIENGTLEVLIEHLLLEGDSPSVYAFKREIVNFLIEIVDFINISLLSQKNIFEVLNNLNSLKLLSILISPTNYHWIEIDSKKDSLCLSTKYYKLINDTKTIIDILSRHILKDTKSLFYLKDVLEGNLEAQEYASTLLPSICIRYSNTITEEVVLVLSCFVESIESNRKTVWESQIFENILRTFMQPETHKSLVYAIITFLKGMTKSILFLRVHLLEYPIVEHLFVKLSSFPKDVLFLFSNLVFDYGNCKAKFIKLGGLPQILQFKKDFPVEILTICKNFCYDTNWEIKELFIGATDEEFLNYFFGLYEEQENELQSDLLLQNELLIQTLWNLIRNLVCEDSLELVLVSFKGVIQRVLEYLHLDLSPPVLIHLLYTIVNLSANSNSFRNLLFEGDHLNRLKGVCVTGELQLAFVWIVINLSWRDEGYEGRVEKLKGSGIKEFLLGMNASDSDLMDKINTALENIK